MGWTHGQNERSTEKIRDKEARRLQKTRKITAKGDLRKAALGGQQAERNVAIQRSDN